MRTHHSRLLLGVCFGVAMVTGAPPAHAAVGARVLLQEWSPYNPSKQPVRTVADDPSAVSDAVQKAWSEARPRICDELSKVMGKGASKGAGNSIYSVHYALVGDGWDGRTVVPQPNAERNYVIRGSLQGSATMDPAATLKPGAANPLDPRIQGADQVTAQAGASPSQSTILSQGKTATTGKAATPFAGTRARSANVDAVSLNPQPLPPDPPDSAIPSSRWNAVQPRQR